MSGYGLNYRRKSIVPQIFKVILATVASLVIAFVAYKSFIFVKEMFISREMYVGSSTARIQLIEDFETLSLSLDDVPRGAKVTTYGFGKRIEVSNEKFFKISYRNKEGRKITGYIDANNIVADYSEVVFEKEVFASSDTYISGTKDFDSLSGFIKKGDRFTVKEWELNDDGSIAWYYLENDQTIGYSNGNYFDTNYDYAMLWYDVNNYFKSRDLLHLDFRPRVKNYFDLNPRVDEARAWYITPNNLIEIDSFINAARSTNINTFIIDFKVSDGIVFESGIAHKYASETVNLTDFSMHQFMDIIKELSNNGIYTVARIEVFKDQGYALSNPNATIKYLDGEPFTDEFDELYLNPENLDVWTYNYRIAAQAKEIGFNEVLLDFVRYPNVKSSIDDKLDYDTSISKEERIQTFSRYIYDQLSNHEIYVSATTLGQVAYFDKSDRLIHGQQWHVMSNIFDYLYPKFFIENYASSYLSGKSPFTYQYDMIYLLNSRVNELNLIVSKAAEVRPIIQCYNNWGYYNWENIDGEKISRQIQAIYDNGNKGFVAWSEDDTIEKYLYEGRIEAFKKEYKKEDYSGSFE